MVVKGSFLGLGWSGGCWFVEVGQDGNGPLAVEGMLL